MKKFLLVLWQLPQYLLALILLIGKTEKKSFIIKGKERTVYFSRLVNGGGISLGEFIIYPSAYSNYNPYIIQESIIHEQGHCIQSTYLGPLYLLIVGVPSIMRNIYHKLFHRKWIYANKKKWYHSGYPEKWADNLGKSYFDFT